MPAVRVERCPPFAAGKIPQRGPASWPGPVDLGDHQRVAVRRKKYEAYGPIKPRDLFRKAAACCIPQDDLRLGVFFVPEALVGAGQYRAIGRKRQVVHVVVVAFQRKPFCPARCVPERDRAVHAAGRYGLAIRGERDTVDHVVVWEQCTRRVLASVPEAVPREIAEVLLACAGRRLDSSPRARFGSPWFHAFQAQQTLAAYACLRRVDSRDKTSARSLLCQGCLLIGNLLLCLRVLPLILLTFIGRDEEQCACQ